MCTKEFTTASSKNRHMAIHKLEKTHKCEVCSKVFNTKGNLRQHKRLVHNKEPKNFMCEICGKDFDRKCRLTEHSRVHTGERPFVCDVKVSILPTGLDRQKISA